MNTAKEAVRLARQMLDEGWQYVYGAKCRIGGAPLTLAKINQLIECYPSYFSDETTRSLARDAAGKMGLDCSGLICACFDIPSKGSTQLKNSAKDGKLYPISTVADAPAGACVWRQGHIGMYVGQHRIIEARSEACDIDMTIPTERNFTHWFLLPDVDYTGCWPGDAPEQAEEEQLTKNTAWIELTGSMKVRGTASYSGPVVGYLKRGQVVTGVGIEENGMVKILYAGNAGAGGYAWLGSGSISGKYGKIIAGSLITGAEETAPEIVVGNVVEFTGNVHYTNSYVSGKAKGCKPGKALVVRVDGKVHKYMLKRLENGGSTVNGWVDEADVKK